MTRFNLNLNLPNSAGECPIRVSITAEGKRKMTTVGYSINPEQWDKSTMRVRTGGKKNPVVNSRGIPATVINARLTEIDSCFSKIAATPGALTFDNLCREFSNIVGKKPGGKKPDKGESEVFTAYDEYFACCGSLDDDEKGEWTYSTEKSYRSLRWHLKTFEKVMGGGKAELTFNCFNKAGLTAFVRHLRVGPDKSGVTIERDEYTVNKYYRQLKTFLKWAIQTGYCTTLDILSYSPRFASRQQEHKPVIAFTVEEVNRLRNFQIPANGTVVTLVNENGKEYTKTVEEAGGLERARDLFCFCVFTGLRYSDMADIRRSDVRYDKEGGFIYVVAKKTGKVTFVAITRFVKEILDKYANYHDEEDHALPRLSLQKMNKHLKNVCELCGFNDLIPKTYHKGGKQITVWTPKWKLIGTHAGRRTFTSNTINEGQASPKVAAQQTNHPDISAMKPYMDELDSKLLASQLREIQDRLYGEDNNYSKNGGHEGDV